MVVRMIVPAVVIVRVVVVMVMRMVVTAIMVVIVRVIVAAIVVMIVIVALGFRHPQVLDEKRERKRAIETSSFKLSPATALGNPLAAGVAKFS